MSFESKIREYVGDVDDLNNIHYSRLYSMFNDLALSVARSSYTTLSDIDLETVSHEVAQDMLMILYRGNDIYSYSRLAKKMVSAKVNDLFRISYGNKISPVLSSDLDHISGIYNHLYDTDVNFDTPDILVSTLEAAQSCVRDVSSIIDSVEFTEPRRSLVQSLIVRRCRGDTSFYHLVPEWIRAKIDILSTKILSIVIKRMGMNGDIVEYEFR